MQNVEDISFWQSHPSINRMGGPVRFLDRNTEDPHEQLLIEVQQGCVGLLKNHPAGKLMQEFDFLVVETSVRNAAALTQEGQFAVALSTGLLEAVSRIVRRLICSASLLGQNFGRAPRSEASLWASDPTGFLTTASERERRYFMNCLDRALEFVALHELSHGLRDHASLLRTTPSDCLFEEVLWLSEAGDVSSREERHRCEIDADIYALRLSQPSGLQGEISRSADDDLEAYWLSEIVIQCFALVSVFLALEDQSQKQRVGYDGLYPPLLHRAIIVCDTVQSYFATRGRIDPEDVSGYVSQIWIDLAETSADLDIPGETWVKPRDSKIALEQMNTRLVDFRRFQDNLDERMAQRLRDHSLQRD